MILLASITVGFFVSALGIKYDLIPLAAFGLLIMLTGMLWFAIGTFKKDITYSTCSDVKMYRLTNSVLYEGCGRRVEMERFGLHEKPEDFKKIYSKTVTDQLGTTYTLDSIYKW